MSEYSYNKEKRIIELEKLFYAILKKKRASEAIKNNQTLINQTIPSDIITLVDILVKSKRPIEELKIGINKFLNVFYTHIQLLS